MKEYTIEETIKIIKKHPPFDIRWTAHLEERKFERGINIEYIIKCFSQLF